MNPKSERNLIYTLGALVPLGIASVPYVVDGPKLPQALAGNKVLVEANPNQPKQLQKVVTAQPATVKLRRM